MNRTSLTPLAFLALAACQEPTAPTPAPLASLCTAAPVDYSAGRWTAAPLFPNHQRGDLSVSVYDMNNAGQVSGWNGAAFRVTVGRPEDIISLRMYAGRTINDLGDVVGDPTYRGGAVLQTADGQRTELPVPFEGYTLPLDINNRRQVVGISGGRAVLWQPDGSVMDLAPGRANALNERGMVTGETGGRAFLWAPGAGLQLLATPEGGTSIGRALNDAGVVVGSVTEPGGRSQPAVWTTPGKYTLLNTGDAIQGQATGINNACVIVGERRVESAQGGFTVWPSPTSAPQVLPVLDSPVGIVVAINDRGQVLGAAGPAGVIWTFGPAASSMIAAPGSRSSAAQH